MKHVVLIFLTIFGCAQLANASGTPKSNKKPRKDALKSIPECGPVISLPSEEMGSYDPDHMVEILSPRVSAPSIAVSSAQSSTQDSVGFAVFEGGYNRAYALSTAESKARLEGVKMSPRSEAEQFALLELIQKAHPCKLSRLDLATVYQHVKKPIA